MDERMRRRVFIVALFAGAMVVGAIVIVVGIHTGFGVTMPGASYP